MRVTLTEDERLNALEIRFTGYLNTTIPKYKRIYKLLRENHFEFWPKPVSAFVGKDTPHHRQMFAEIEKELNAA